MKRSTKNRILSVAMTASMIISLTPAGIYAAEADVAEADVVCVEETGELPDPASGMEELPGEPVLTLDGSAAAEEILFEAENAGELSGAENSGGREAGEAVADIEAGSDVQAAQEETIGTDPEWQLQEIQIEEIVEAESEPDLAVWEEPKEAAEEPDYALMNIPYAAFYQAVGVGGSADYDAMSSATNKAGNYGKAGGAFHSKTTAEVGTDGAVTAVGGANGAKNEGVIWPVKISEGAKGKLSGLGGKEITSESKVTTATLGKGSTSVNYLVSYEALTEAPAYSYYYLSSEPTNYLTLDVDSQGKAQFSSGKDGTVSRGTIELADSYGTHHADVQLVVEAAPEELSDKLVNAVVITTSDGSTGLVHVDNIWAANELGWNVSAGPDLGGKTITGIRYYCSVKDDTVGEDNSEAPAYQNYVYEYSVGSKQIKKYSNAENLKAEFEGNDSITVTGLPEDIQNPKAAVYHTDGGRPATLTYLTPTTTDEGGNTVPEEVTVENGKIALASAPTDGTEYTVAVSSDNYAFSTITTMYKAPEPETPGSEPETPGTSGSEPETPGTGTGTPGSEPETPGTSGSESGTPGTGTGTPGSGTETPGQETEKPGAETEKPGPETEKPGTETEKPGPETEKPGTETEKPEPEVRYTVTYKVNGQKQVRNMPGKVSCEAGKNTVVKGKPVSKTRFFAGWNTKADGKGKTYQAGDKIKMTANVTLYAQWKDACTVSKLTYKVSGYNQVTCTGTTGKKQTSVRIPTNVKYAGITYQVTSVSKKAFEGMEKLKKAVIGNQVKTIGNKAFYKCTALKSVVIGKGLVTIGRNAFDSVKKGCVISISSTKLKTVKTAIGNGTENMTVKVPKSRLKAYKKLIQKKAKDVLVKAK